MRLIKFLFYVTAALFAVGAASLPAKAELSTYQYVGNNFTSLVGTSTLGSSDNLIITI